LFPSDVVPRAPRLHELEDAINLWKRLGKTSDLVGPSGQALAESFAGEIDRNPDLVAGQTATWRALVKNAAEVTAFVRSDWAAARRAPAPHTIQFVPLVPAGGPVSLVVGDPMPAIQAESDRRADESEVQRREQFVGIPVIFIVRALIARMWKNVLFVAGAVALLALSLWGYRIQMRPAIEEMLWGDIIAAVCIVLYVFVAMERDELLSHVTSTTPGQISWDRDFVVKLVIYGLIPLAGLFATQFPNISSTLVQWLEPVQKALP